MAVATKWATWLPVVAAGAVGAYAVMQRRGRRPNGRANGRGTGMLADSESDTRQQLGGSGGVLVEESVTVNRPIGDVYRFWRDFENLPRFMNHLESVSQREMGISHWVAKGPAGTRVAWDARIINEIDDRLIGWQSLDGSTVSTAGSVNFRERPRGTEVRVRLQYSPPAGKVGAAVARLFGEEPGAQIREDLHRFKQLMETGAIQSARERSFWNGGVQ